MQTPLSWLAGRYSLDTRAVRLAALVSVVASIAITVTGGIVRVTGSGLGCTDWPMCTGETLAPTAEMGLHGAIEFGNRLLTGALCAVVGWVIITARLQKEPAPSVLRGAWAQFWIVVLNAIVGGVTVWMRLSPYIVAAHFLAATLLLTAAVYTWHAACADAGGEGNVGGEGDAPTPDGPRLPARCRSLSVALVAVTAVLVVVGTLATGTGPHAGDSSDVERMPFNWTAVTVVHGVLAATVLVLACCLLAALPREGFGDARAKTVLFLAVLLAQGAVGLVQSLTGLPSLAVVLHLLGSALVWIGVLQVHLTLKRADPGFPRPLAAAAPHGARSEAAHT
ncbi:heme A synthase [Streptomyces sp. NBC_01408]|uniref:COX15/CtaA family protein n=1 Tax=Streptomyces sp. NBC_01408 TaxID=2903855 RepID=UPI00225A6C8E|nr:COX15/CtaA family protein [Streptomyces sp. NBC_01408]MCX4694750.1 COX15/CtaA family protein [Streptomyces sp. NBC_01408]